MAEIQAGLLVLGGAGLGALAGWSLGYRRGHRAGRAVIYERWARTLACSATGSGHSAARQLGAARRCLRDDRGARAHH